MHVPILTKKKLFNSKVRYIIFMKIYLVWLIGVIIWNFSVPNAAPIEDVIVAIVLSFMSNGLKKIIK